MILGSADESGRVVEFLFVAVGRVVGDDRPAKAGNHRSYLIRSSRMVAIRRVMFGVVIAALSLIPIPYRACPMWDVLVVDDSGHPVPGVTVRLVYQNYSAESQSHQEDRITNESGRAAFPRQVSSASILRRCYYTGLSAGASVHASFGRHAWVFAFGKGLEGTATSGQVVTDWTGSPDHIESKIVASVNEPGPPKTFTRP